MSEKKTAKSTKINFTLKSDTISYDFTLINKEEELTFKFEDLKVFPIKIYELKIEFEKLKQLDDNFSIFKKPERFIKAIKNSIDANRYSIEFNNELNEIIFEIKNELFEDGGARIKIPEQEQALETQVEVLTKTLSEMMKEIQNLKQKSLDKDEAAIKSFLQTSFLNNEEKKMISKWIHPDKVIRFNLLFSSDKDGDRASTFHQICDGIFPTITVIQDTSGRKFGGYSTQNWGQSNAGASYTRAPESFIFNLSNKQKFELNEQFHKNAVYRHNSYGPTFGGGHDLYIPDQFKSNNSSCNKNTYNTGNTNLLGINGSTSFIVTYLEVYKVIFE